MLATPSGLPVTAAFDFRQTGEQSWDIRIETEAGTLLMSGGGARLAHDGRSLIDEPEREYPGLYRRFVELARTGRSEVDLAPLALVADAFLLGRRRSVEAFEG